MKINSIHRLRRLALVGASLLGLAALPTRAHAVFTFTLSQVGADVVIAGSGTLNTTALTLGSTSTTSPQIFPGFGGLLSGPLNSSATTYSGVTATGSLGAGGPANATSGTGSFVGVIGIAGQLNVPSGYVSGSPLTSTSTYANSTISSLGFTPGSTAFTWGTGATADSLVVNVPTAVPEPSTWALLGLGVAGVGIVTLRRRRAFRLA